MSPSAVPGKRRSPTTPGSMRRTAAQNVASIVMPPVAVSHLHAATVPPGRVTRAISRTPWSGSSMKPSTRECERRVELPVRPGQRLAGADADVDARVALATGGRELRSRVDRGHSPGAEPLHELARQA